MSAITARTLNDDLATVLDVLEAAQPDNIADAAWAYADACEKAPRPVLVWHLARLTWRAAVGRSQPEDTRHREQQ